MELLNLKLPIFNTFLIEASAGSGKTYTIVTLYLQLLIGHNKGEKFQPFNVEEILILTFTEIAIIELRKRIKTSIFNLKIDCMKGEKTNKLITNVNNLNDIYTYLVNAERKIDEAPIYTIHSFCKKILESNILTSNYLFKKNFIKNEITLYKNLVCDFWRLNFYSLPLDIIKLIKIKWVSPDHLFYDIKPFIHNNSFKILDDINIDIKESIINRYFFIINYINELKTNWKDAINNINIINNKLSYLINKINNWANFITKDFSIPKEINKVEHLILNSNLNYYIKHKFIKFFNKLKKFNSIKISLYNLIIQKVLLEIKKSAKIIKKSTNSLEFDDLLIYMENILNSYIGKNLSKFIRKKYPIAMIDEFQDTNPQQYRIFQHIYKSHYKCGLVLIADPKQAIYGFRGADIFNYINIRKNINLIYTLNRNWRSSHNIIISINALFKSVKNPFILNEIRYKSIKSSSINKNLKFIIKKNIQPAFSIYLHPNNKISINEYKKFMALKFSNIISSLINNILNNEAYFKTKSNKIKFLKISDIVILVRNYSEYCLIQEELIKKNILSIYTSKNISIFSTQESLDLMYLLKAILNPKDINTLRCALITKLIGLNSIEIDLVNNNIKCLEKIIDKFIKYKICWENNGIVFLINKILMENFSLTDKLNKNNNEYYLNNILHLSELLHEYYIKVNSKFLLIQWLDFNINNPDINDINQHIKLKNSKYLIKIMSIHKSKGLEFPIVLIPFISSFKQQKIPYFHDRRYYKQILDLNYKKSNLDLSEEERLSEDIRLLYVAITRSIYHCIIGIASVFYNTRKNTNISDFHKSAIGFLIQQGQPCTYEQLKNKLSLLSIKSKKNILIFYKYKNIKPIVYPINKHNIVNSHKQKQFIIQDFWKITSYTNLIKQNTILLDKNNVHNEFIDFNLKVSNTNKLTQHNFPHGSYYGLFLHKLFEILIFNKTYDNEILLDQFKLYKIDLIWFDMVKEWIFNIMHVKLDNKKLSLSVLKKNNYYPEWKFYLSIKSKINISKIYEICKKYSTFFKYCNQLKHNIIRGMLYGVIDLIFRYQKKYYIVDYKSNWLGLDISCYNNEMMKKSIIENTYELQYNIYTLALHRFLCNKFNNYHYQKHFGGIYYLFVRGININKPNYGIYYNLPKYSLIHELDQLFS
ncbi:MAG: exodeoxyribonuclease V subunit beta [Enterobacterales bacterium]